MNHYLKVKSKILTDHQLLHTLELWQRNHEKVVFTNGCFDLIHQGHIDYLSKAAGLGTKLILGVNTDRSVSAIKGRHRPIQDEQSRLMILAAMEFVDAVILFDQDTPLQLITQVQPDVLVKGSDYKAADIVGYDVVMAKGGSVQTLDFLPGYSTSGIERKIIEAHQ